MARRIAGKRAASLPSHADDIASAAMLGLVQAATRYKGKIPFPAFASHRIHGAIHDEVMRSGDVLPRRERAKVKRAGLSGPVACELTDTIPDEAPLPDEIAEAKAERQSIREKALRFLDQRELRIVAMRYDEEKTLLEIGQALGITESRACQLHTRLLKKLAA